MQKDLEDFGKYVDNPIWHRTLYKLFLKLPRFEVSRNRLTTFKP